MTEEETTVPTTDSPATDAPTAPVNEEETAVPASAPTEGEEKAPETPAA